MSRAVLLVTHIGRDAALRLSRGVANDLLAAGIEVLVPEDEAAVIDVAGVKPAPISPDGAVREDFELVVVVGGDGTILRAAERSRGCSVPLLGVNLGHVGFLAEAEPEDREGVVEAVVNRRYRVEERMAIAVRVLAGDQCVFETWALNEFSIEKSARQKMLEIGLSVDGQALSEWGCDGLVCSTPTGSTAYAFSAGGPVVWPEVEALLMVPLSAHALFARPLVVSPNSVITVRLLARTNEGVLYADGRRSFDLLPDSVIEVRRSEEPVRFARIHDVPFTGRLVAKFDLPVTGWRGP